MTLRVVNLGLPKTGTTTLAVALGKSGFRVADHRIRAKQSTDPQLQGKFVADLLYRGYFETGDPATYLPGFDAISETSLLLEGRSIWPQMDFGLIDAIRTHHKGVKFVASNRNSRDLSQSMLAWSNLGMARLPKSAIPGLPQGYGQTTKERILWVEGHYAHLRKLFAGDPNFLEYDIGDPLAKSKISAFLGVEIAWWGRANANPANV